MNSTARPWYKETMPRNSNSKKIISLPQPMPAGELLDALKGEFPQFDFKLDGVDILAEGDAWSLSGSQRPAMGSMAMFAKGYLKCLQDVDAPRG